MESEIHDTPLTNNWTILYAILFFARFVLFFADSIILKMSLGYSDLCKQGIYVSLVI